MDGPRERKRRRHRYLFRVGLMALLTGTLLCMGFYATTASAVAGATSKASGRSLAAYQNCLKSHGVKATFGSGAKPPSGKLPEGGIPGGKLPTTGISSKFLKAQAACRSKMPTGGLSVPGAAPSGSSGGLSNLQAYESCLTDNGIKLKGSGPRALASLNQSSSKVQAAMKTCEPLLNTATTTSTTS